MNSVVDRLSYVHSRPWPVGSTGMPPCRARARAPLPSSPKSKTTTKPSLTPLQRDAPIDPARPGPAIRTCIPSKPLFKVQHPHDHPGQWISCLCKKCTNTSDLRHECEKRSRGRGTACRRAPTAVHPRIGPSYGRGHRQHAWYARTARLKSIMKDSRLLEKSTQNDLESVHQVPTPAEFHRRVVDRRTLAVFAPRAPLKHVSRGVTSATALDRRDGRAERARGPPTGNKIEHGRVLVISRLQDQ